MADFGCPISKLPSPGKDRDTKCGFTLNEKLRMKIFLLAGQSNMQGCGKIAGYPVLHDARIFNLATGSAEVAVEPLHHWNEHPFMPRASVSDSR